MADEVESERHIWLVTLWSMVGIQFMIDRKSVV